MCSLMKPSKLHAHLLKGRGNHAIPHALTRRSNKDSQPTLVQNKFLKCLRLVSRMGGSSTPVCGVATPCHPQARGIVW